MNYFQLIGFMIKNALVRLSFTVTSCSIFISEGVYSHHVAISSALKILAGFSVFLETEPLGFIYGHLHALLPHKLLVT